MSTSATVTLNGELVRIERVSARKASVALSLMRAITREAPELQRDVARFRRDYERENVVELDRVQARVHFPPRPIVLEDGTYALDEHGAPRMLPSPIDHLSEEDWRLAGNVYRMPASPSMPEIATALLDRALELAEANVYKLLALFTMPNADVTAARRDGSLPDELERRADELLDAYADELVELAVVCGETVDGQFRRKIDELGDRLGNALRLVGMDPARLRTESTPSSPPTPASTSEEETPSDGSSSSTPSSSTPSPAPTQDGDPTTSSSSPTSSSSSSADSSSATPPSEQPPTPSMAAA